MPHLLDKITDDAFEARSKASLEEHTSFSASTAQQINEQLRDAGLRETFSGLVADINGKLDESETARQHNERQWLRNVRSYRGQDSGEGAFRHSEKSKVYVRTTTVKVKAAYAQIIEALFNDTAFPIGISDTFIPEGVSQFAHLKTDMEENVAPPETPDSFAPPEPEGLGFEGDGFELEPGATGAEGLNFLGGLEEELEESAENIKEGPAREGEPFIKPSKMLARRMERMIHDQLEETGARTELRRMVQEMCLLGTGIMKGPFNVNKTLHKWVHDEETGEMVYTPSEAKTARSSMVSVWNFYPDPNATVTGELEWAIERHKMNASQVKALRKRPHFNREAIERLIFTGGNYERRSFESTLDEKSNGSQSEGRLFEVLEFWGFVDRKFLKEHNIDIPSDMEEDELQANVWVSGNEVLRIVLNPFIPQRIPYFVTPYEVDQYSIWGTGVPESMEDSQALMNGFARLAVDNLALAGNLVFEIDETMLAPGQPTEVEPGTIFKKQTGVPGQAVFGHSFPNTAPANMQMFDRFRQIADESTGIPSFAHGQTGVTSPTRTASGMSMLLNNASLNIKTVIRNLDDYLLKPWGESYYRWNMQFNNDGSIVGDLEVKATGSSSLQAKEIRSARLNSFLQMAGNPALAPLIKIPTILREFALTMDIDPDEILNSPDEAAIYAGIIGMQGGAQGSAAPQQPGLSPGEVPAPGQEGFTGNDLGGGAPIEEVLSGVEGA